MKNKVDPYKSQLTSEEQEWLASFEAGEWKTIDDIGNAKALARQAATHYLQKDARINIRISSSDLASLKQKAAYKGLPYQTLIASVLHEYAAGHFEGKL
jgi:predicted DNA binding CopG/RHH family protein